MVRTCSVLAGAVAGCVATYAPPVRTVHGGAPGRLVPGDMEVTGATVGVIAPAGGGSGALGYAIRPGLAVTAGVDGMGHYTLGWGGIRTPGRLHLRPRVSLAGEMEIGAGVGVGGRNDCDEQGGDDPHCVPDKTPWYQRPAGGGYLGAAGAFRWGPVSLYTRGRLQVAGAEHLPVTQWASLFGGLHVHILDRAFVWGGVAIAGYTNGVDAARGMVSEIGLGFRFDPHVGWRR